jgi:ankyrin repeat protein
MFIKKKLLLSILCLLSNFICAMEDPNLQLLPTIYTNSGLMTAVKKNTLSEVKQLLADQVFSDKDLHYALAEAFKYGNKECAEHLMALGAPLDIQGRSAIFKNLGIRGEVEIFDWLVRNYPLPKEKISNSFLWAASSGQTGLIEYLLDSENRLYVDPNCKGYHGNTPLIWSAGNGHVKTTQSLLNHGASVDVLNDDNQSALHWAAAQGYEYKNSSLPTENITKGYSTPEQKQTAFASIARMLLAQKPDLLTKSSGDGFLPLHCAVIGGNVEIVKMVVSAAQEQKNLQCMINNQDTTSQRTPLAWATRMSENEYTKKERLQHDRVTSATIVKLLLENGAHDDIADKTGKTAREWMKDTDLTEASTSENWRSTKKTTSEATSTQSYSGLPKPVRAHQNVQPLPTSKPGAYIPPHLRKQ